MGDGGVEVEGVDGADWFVYPGCHGETGCEVWTWGDQAGVEEDTAGVFVECLFGFGCLEFFGFWG